MGGQSTGGFEGRARGVGTRGGLEGTRGGRGGRGVDRGMIAGLRGETTRDILALVNLRVIRPRLKTRQQDACGALGVDPFSLPFLHARYGKDVCVCVCVRVVICGEGLII